MSFITSLISISSVATWIFLPLNAIFLTLDGIVYSLVAYSYKIFMLIAQLNYNVLYAWIAPLVDRVKAIILVLIMFKIGYALIQYMINPDKLDDASQGGPALIKNIAIASIMLIVYTFVFSFMNELTLLFIGVPDGYEFTTLKQVADVTNTTGKTDSGLIARFIFGKEADNVGEFGKQLAVNTLNIFLYSRDGKSTPLDDIYNENANGDLNAFNMMKIVTIVTRIDKDIEYKWPLVSTAAGLYLAWQIIKLAIELAIRMFKLIVLQVLAPLAIVSIVDGGTKNSTWSSYVKTFIGTWMDAFVRVGSLFLATALVGKFWVEKSELMPEATGITKGLIFLIIMFSAYKCVEIIPKLIKQIFPSMNAGGDNAKGFGGLIGGLAGAGFGAASGIASGALAGAGVAGTLGNMVRGGAAGLQSGARGKNVMDFFSKQSKVSQGNRDMAQRIARQGGGFRAAGAAIESRLGIPQGEALRAQMYEDDNKLIDNVLNAQANEIKDQQDGKGLEYGTDANAYAEKFAQADSVYQKRKQAYDDLVTQRQERIRTGQNTDLIDGQISKAKRDMEGDFKLKPSMGKQAWNNAANNASGAEVTRAKTDLATSGRSKETKQLNSTSSRADLEAARKANVKNKDELLGKGSSQRANRQSSFGGK